MPTSPRRAFYIGEVFNSVYFSGFDLRGDAALGDAAFVVTGKERVFAIEGDGADEVFDPFAVGVYAAIGQEGLQPLPMVVDVGWAC